MDLRQGIAARGTSFSLGLGAEVAPAAWLRARISMGHNAARIIVKSEPIQRNFHYLLVTGFESHGLIWRCADESLRILAADRSVEEVQGCSSRGNARWLRDRHRSPSSDRLEPFRMHYRPWLLRMLP